MTSNGCAFAAAPRCNSGGSLWARRAPPHRLYRGRSERAALGEGVWALIIGDVSGKGSRAALLVSTIDSALRVLLDQNRLDNDLVRRLNQYVYDASTGNKYVTMALARLNDAVAEFSTGLAQGDDQTVILLRRR